MKKNNKKITIRLTSEQYEHLQKSKNKSQLLRDMIDLDIQNLTETNAITEEKLKNIDNALTNENAQARYKVSYQPISRLNEWYKNNMFLLRDNELTTKESENLDENTKHINHIKDLGARIIKARSINDFKRKIRYYTREQTFIRLTSENTATSEAIKFKSKYIKACSNGTYKITSFVYCDTYVSQIIQGELKPELPFYTKIETKEYKSPSGQYTTDKKIKEFYFYCSEYKHQTAEEKQINKIIKDNIQTISKKKQELKKYISQNAQGTYKKHLEETARQEITSYYRQNLMQGAREIAQAEKQEEKGKIYEDILEIITPAQKNLFLKYIEEAEKEAKAWQ